MFPLIILAGPTASGKSKLALELAEQLNTEIISADSMQVYKYFDIGTAKPTQEIRRCFPHHLIDIREPGDDFNAYDFKTLALEKARHLVAQKKIPIIAGGTGLYLKTLMEDFDCATRVAFEIRDKVKTAIAVNGPEKIYKTLTQVDPIYAKKITPTDLLRIERAYSVYLETGKPFSQFHQEEISKNHEFDANVFILNRNRRDLYQRIERRIDAMVEQGWVEEVAGLLKQGFHRNLRPFQSIGYSQLAEYLENQRPLAEAISEIKKETRNYAKRQLTWFRKTPGAKSLSISSKDTPINLKDRILSYLPHLMGVILGSLINLSIPVLAETVTPFTEGIRWFDQGDFLKAEERFQELSKNGGTSKVRSQAFYFLGLTQKEQKKFSSAIHSFQSILKTFIEIEDYIHYRLAESHFQMDQFTPALRHLNMMLTSPPGNRFSVEAELLRAVAMEKLGYPSKAIKKLTHSVNRLSKNGGRSSDQLPRMIFKLGQMCERVGQSTPAYQAYKKLYLEYPDHSLEIGAKKRMAFLEQSINFEAPPLEDQEYLMRIRKLLDKAKFNQVVEEIAQIEKKQNLSNSRFYVYRAKAFQALKQRSAAHQTWKQLLKKFPRHSKRQAFEFQLARNLWNMGEDEKAEKRFEKLAAERPESAWTMKSRYFQGRTLQSQGRLKEALNVFRFLEKQQGEEAESQKAIWRIGWIYYLKNDYEKAIRQFKKNIKRFPEGLMIESNLYWLGKSLEGQNQFKKAHQIYRKLYSRYPYRYYGLRARNRLNRDKKFSWNQKVPVKTVSLRSDVPVSRPKLNSKAQRRYRRAMEMIDMHLLDNARYEIKLVEPHIRKNYFGTIWLANLYQQAEGYSETYRIMELYRNYKTKGREKDLPYLFWSLYFPLAYEEAIRAQSEKYGIDSYFINSIIRQESLFDRLSLSSAGARGLMQIMPGTGKRLHETEETRPFEVDSLFQANFNIGLGAKYLNQLKKHYQGNWVHILICYNAGPGVLEKWRKRFNDITDPDTFIESIPYPETRKYVKLVLRNYGIYQILYPRKL